METIYIEIQMTGRRIGLRGSRGSLKLLMAILNRILTGIPDRILTGIPGRTLTEIPDRILMEIPDSLKIPDRNRIPGSTRLRILMASPALTVIIRAETKMVIIRFPTTVRDSLLIRRKTIWLYFL